MTVSILGCGWYGSGLAKDLLKHGIAVKGSTTSVEKLNILEAENIPAYFIKIDSIANSVISQEFFSCDIFIVANNVKMEQGNYIDRIYTTIALAQKFNIKKVIFISSISVYGDPNATVNELSDTGPLTASGKLLLQAEKLFSSNTSFKTTIVRFGGLVGPGRDPGRFLAGKINIPNGQAPINLIELDDCIGITLQVINSGIEDVITNAVSPHHPPKSEFYIEAAKRSGLPIPGFIDEKKQWKIVSSVPINKNLAYEYKVTDWFKWLKSR